MNPNSSLGPATIQQIQVRSLDLGGDLGADLGVVLEELLRVLAALTELDLVIGEPGAGLLADLGEDGKVEHVEDNVGLIEHCKKAYKANGLGEDFVDQFIR